MYIPFMGGKYTKKDQQIISALTVLDTESNWHDISGIILPALLNDSCYHDYQHILILASSTLHFIHAA